MNDNRLAARHPDLGSSQARDAFIPLVVLMTDDSESCILAWPMGGVVM